MTEFDTCLDCEATCCRHYSIQVTPSEAEHIAAHLGRAPTTFVHPEIESFAPEMPVVYLDVGPSQLALARRAGSGECVFLDPETLLCSIHEHTPYICRMYPYTVTDGGCQALKLRREIYCQFPPQLDEDLQERLLLRYRRFWHEDINAYRQLAQRWNFEFAGGEMAVFLAYCRGELDSGG